MPIRDTSFIHETFRKLGRWVLSCHAKDLKWVVQVNINFTEVPPGQGVIPGQENSGIDYHAYLSEIGKVGVSLMMEHFVTNEEFLEGARKAFSSSMRSGLWSLVGI